MLRPQSLTTFAALAAVLVQAQQSPNNTNRAVDILPCNAIPNIDLSSGTVCERAGLASTGVGIAPDVFATNNASTTPTKAAPPPATSTPSSTSTPASRPPWPSQTSRPPAP
ncbi:hypothetical protein WHR41_00899 [Cladosporium halotolerans]|uniref:Uncharacterized protein n=1 Tax=Cladosporium halotolerans TaxID=1052096 RepID=A0AB34L4G1_9PEZI